MVQQPWHDGSGIFRHPNHHKIVHESRKLILCPPPMLKHSHVKLCLGFRLLTWIVPDLGCHLQAVCLNAPNPCRLFAAHSSLAAWCFGGMKSDWMLSLSQLCRGCLHGLYRQLFESLPGLCDAPSFEGWDGPMPRPQHTPQASLFQGYLKFQGMYEKIL